MEGFQFSGSSNPVYPQDIDKSINHKSHLGQKVERFSQGNLFPKSNKAMTINNIR